MSAGIYYIWNLGNHRAYIGKACDLDKRWHEHRRALNRGCHQNRALQADWDIYGESAFEFGVLTPIDRVQHDNLSFCRVERLFIEAYRADRAEFGYNADHHEKGRRNQASAQRKCEAARCAGLTGRLTWLELSA